jgi:hypothetical protein
MAFVKKHKDLDSHIENVYNFQDIWKNTCSKYYDDIVEEQPSILPKVDRIIVLGDVHGDWDMMHQALRLAKVVDKNGDWIGDKTVVVQVGDQIDRCRYSYGGPTCDKKEATDYDEKSDWKILKYFTKLHNQAAKDGGAVYSLLGNHELMNVDQDFRYVSYQGLREFDNFKHKKLDPEIQNGEMARRWAFKPGNPISEFLACTRQAALIIGSNLFVHAGIIPKLAKKYGVQNINKIMSLYLLNKIKTTSQYKDLFNQSNSPLWTRVYGNIGMDKYSRFNPQFNEKSIQDKCDSLMNPLQKIYKVDRMFVGHTPIFKGIGDICDGRVWLTDYGLSKAFDKFDSNSTFVSLSERQGPRSVQILEILNDGETINIIKDKIE